MMTEIRDLKVFITKAKLDVEAVREIRRLHAPGDLGYKVLARRFGVSRETIRDIIRRRTWRYA